MNLEPKPQVNKQMEPNISDDEFSENVEDVKADNLAHYRKLKAAQEVGTPAVRQALIEILRDNPVDKLPDTDVIFWRDFFLARLEMALKRDGVKY